MDFLESGLHLGGTDVSQVEYAFIIYVCMYVCTLFGALVGAPIAIRRTDRDSARRSLFGATIGVLGGIDVSPS